MIEAVFGEANRPPPIPETEHHRREGPVGEVGRKAIIAST